MPNIPTGGAELPRAVIDTTVPRMEPVVRAPPLVPQNPTTQQTENPAIKERRKEDRRKRKQNVVKDQRQSQDRREHSSEGIAAEEPESGNATSKPRLGQFINIKV